MTPGDAVESPAIGFGDQHAISYRRLRAPQNDGEALIDPPLAGAAGLLRENAARFGAFAFELSGKSYRSLADEARKELLAVARRYTSSYRDIDNASGALLVLAGHQPQLFHPGVWFKNFALSSVARRASALPTNLIIDNDTIREAAIRVPIRAASSARLESLPLDAQDAEIPFEERRVLDESAFRSFGERVERAISPLVARPLIGRLWPVATKIAEGEPNLGRRIAKARNCFEESWGAAALEAPLGEVCQTAPFLWFACHLLAEAGRFANLHNEALAEYRAVHRIRNRLHPIPPLAVEGQSHSAWVETPFWLWTAADPRRRKAFRRVRNGTLEISDRADLVIALPMTLEGNAGRAVDHLQTLAKGIKLRPRALITTLYSRLFLSDLFLHGVGGAKYDQVTDAIIDRFFGVRAPEFMTVTATCRLPIERPAANDDDMRRLNQELRALQFHPEQALNGDGLPADAREWIEFKKRWTDNRRSGELSVDERRRRHNDVARANSALAPLVADAQARVFAQREPLSEAIRTAKILGSREFSLCLFPEEALCEQLSRLAGLA